MINIGTYKKKLRKEIGARGNGGVCLSGIVVGRLEFIREGKAGIQRSGGRIPEWLLREGSCSCSGDSCRDISVIS